MKIGDIITFRYMGGSNPGAYRTIIIDRLTTLLVGGVQQPNEVYKNYSISLMKDITVVGNQKPPVVFTISNNAMRIENLKISLHPNTQQVVINGVIYDTSKAKQALDALRNC